jgi:hypothetical protein
MNAVKKSREIIGRVVDLFLGDNNSIAYIQKMKDNQTRYL